MSCNHRSEREIPISTYLGIAVLLGLTLIQSSVGPFLSIGGVHPDLVVVAVIGWTLLRGPREGLLWAIIGGIGLDLLSSGPFGVTTIALAITGVLAGLAYGRSFGGYLIIPVSVTFPLSVAYYLIYVALLSLIEQSVVWLPALATAMVPASVLNMAAMLFLFPLLRLLHRRTGREEMVW